MGKTTTPCPFSSPLTTNVNRRGGALLVRLAFCVFFQIGIDMGVNIW